MSLEAYETKKYTKVWSFSEYREASPSVEIWKNKNVKKYIQGLKTFLDAGCGDCVIHKELTRDFQVTGVDLVNVSRFINEFIQGALWNRDIFQNRQWDIVWCCDVLEHIPEEKINSVIKNLRQSCKKVAVFSIYTDVDQMGEKLIGSPLHLTVKPYRFWLQKIQRDFKTIYIESGAQQKRWLIIGTPK